MTARSLPKARPRLWLATRNPKKALELRRLLPERILVRSLADVEEEIRPDLPEDQPDFAGNARRKAEGTASFLRSRPSVLDAGEGAARVLILADDSGLCIDALDGAPGVRSARYAGEGAGDEALCAKVLEALRGLPPERCGARFTCHLHACDLRGAEVFSLSADCEGRIAASPAGVSGFGYDPIFLPGEAPTRSFAELTPVEKDALSHRGRALRRAIPLILEYLS